jgi:hypothetical protein
MTTTPDTITTILREGECFQQTPDGRTRQLASIAPVCEADAPRLWCAMCGKFGDHRSGGCPELHPPKPPTVKESLTVALPKPSKDLTTQSGFAFIHE